MNKVYESKEENLYNEKQTRRYKNVYVPSESVYRLVGYYRQSTTPLLKILVISTVSIDTEYFHPYWCFFTALIAPLKTLLTYYAPHSETVIRKENSRDLISKQIHQF